MLTAPVSLLVGVNDCPSPLGPRSSLVACRSLTFLLALVSARTGYIHRTCLVETRLHFALLTGLTYQIDVCDALVVI
jgi:hypothetical protein